MYETVKTVKGVAIIRMKGTRGQYHINIGRNTEIWFRTIKAAAEWIEANR